MATPEIRNGDFVYRDTLFVEVGEGKRHPRAAPSELKDLLMPTSKGAQTKDQVAHWYEAQLIHYGLTRSKDKNTAKVRLIAALSTDGLKVPSEIQRREGEMKKEYATAVKKLKATDARSGSSSGASSKGQKRKADDGGSTRISLKVDGVELTIDRNTGIPSKKSKNDSMESTKPTPKKSKAETTPAIPKGKPLNGAVPTSAQFHIATHLQSATQARLPLQTARKSRGGSQYPSTSHRSPVNSELSLDRTAKSSSYTNERTEDQDAPPAYDSIDFNHNHQPSSRVQVSGLYIIDTEQTTSEMTLRIDKSKQELWGRFEIGSMEGVLFVDSITGLTAGDRLALRWRAEDTYNQQFLFRRDQTGWIQFDSQGSVHGRFSGLISGNDVDFGGQRTDDDSPEVLVFRSEWDRLPRTAYGRNGH